ncbi:MAG: hypothetical protein JEY99_14955 [Spirochaetales bacterium]|nr:hypothetical protein [Spirochaetales bacterium]
MKYWFAEGKVNVSSTRGDKGGFLVIYEDTAKISTYDSVGHDDLLEELASRYRLDKMEVLNNGIRLFFAYSGEGVLISGVREIDNARIAENPAGYAKIIRKVLY